MRFGSMFITAVCVLFLLKVHQISCPQEGQTPSSSCGCPTRLAAGTVDSLLGKLRAIFSEAGLVGEGEGGWGGGGGGMRRHAGYW